MYFRISKSQKYLEDLKLEFWHKKFVKTNAVQKIAFWHKKFVRLIALQKSNQGTKNRENRWDTKLEFWHEKCVESNDDEYASERPLYCEVNVNKTNF